jgi:formylglycine-generating enzyme required for sulfatase activity
MTKLDLVAIPAGEFSIGEAGEDKFANDTERPRTLVRCGGFLLGRAPVTVGEYRRFRPEHEPGAPEDWPVAGVSWLEAAAYCAWLGEGFRLPTEAEWEYACRAGTTTPFFCGDEITPEQANYLYAEDGHKVGPGHRTPVGSYPANGFGLLDMAGNVNEWTADRWHPSHVDRPIDTAAREDGAPGTRVLRGGSWDYLPRLLRSCWRDWLSETTRRDNVGFRVARDG